MGKRPQSIRNISFSKGGGQATVSFEWSDASQQSWELFEATYPPAFDDIPTRMLKRAMLELTVRVFQGRDIIPDDPEP